MTSATGASSAPAAAAPGPLYTFTAGTGGGKGGGDVAGAAGGAAEAGGLPCLSKPALADKLKQWGLEGDLRGVTLHFTGRFHPESSDDATHLLQALFASPQVLSALGCNSAGGGGGSGGLVVQDVEWSRLRCDVTSMAFFDTLTDAGVVSSTGHIRGVMEEQVAGLSVSDRLREALVLDDSDCASRAFSAEARTQLIFHVFKALVLGGAMCQPEDTLSPYLDVTKSVYKDAVCVYKTKDARPGELQVASHAFAVRSVRWTSAGPRLHASDSPYNACLVVVTPLRGTVTVLHKTFRAFW